MYNQDEVNKNMENLFELTPTVQDKMKNIMRSVSLPPLQDDDNPELINNQIVQKPTPKKGRGGARPNSGRKVGSTVKLSGADILAEIAKRDVPFAEGLAEDYARARQSGDTNLVQRYQQMFLNKVIADKQEVDVTSNGKTLGASFTFPTTELPEWSNEQKKY